MSSKGNQNTDQPDNSAASQAFFIKEGTNLKEFCENLGIRAKEMLQELRGQGFTATVNTELDEDLVSWLSHISGHNIQLIRIEDLVRKEIENHPEQLVPKPPVVTIMGHVDHGKTTLLDSIRESNIADRESGGITQHIGAYRIKYKDRNITFIDTPGHEAFTQMRARGAQITDIVILIVAADDGVMPQTKEAIAHAKAANVPIIVAINKIDKAGVDLDRTKQQLSKEGLLIESWGGEVVSVDISAKEKKNLNELLEMIILVSDVNEIKSNPQVRAQGVVLEARLDSQRGPIATVVIQHGILRHNDPFVSGMTLGKVKALFDEHGGVIKEAGLSMPVEIMGFTEVPIAGDTFQVVEDLEQARKIVQFRHSEHDLERPQKKESMTLDQLFKNIEEGDTKELSLIIKADVHGSMEVLRDILPNLSNDKVQIKIVHAATGNISESDVLLATTSKAIILGYNIRPNQQIMDLAKKENVEIRSYNIIYQLTDDIKKAMIGMLDPIIKETYLGRAEIRKLFHIPRIGLIAGCLVVDGKITRNSKIRVLRENQAVHEGRLSSLKHLKNNVTEVKKDYECGIGVEGFKDIQEGDVIEAFIVETVKPGE